MRPGPAPPACSIQKLFATMSGIEQDLPTILDWHVNEDSNEGLMDAGINELLLKSVNIDKKIKYRLEDINRCLERNADVNTTDENGNTPLLLAVGYGLHDIIDLLLKKNADVNTTNKCGNTPLILAVRNGVYDIVELLLNKNADVNYPGADGKTPLHIAAWFGKTNIMKLLLNRNVDVNAIDGNGNTPLHKAVINAPENIELLLNKNANVNARGLYGRTPLHEAVTHGATNTVKVLLSENADVNAVDEEGDTALHIATFHGEKDIVEMLVKKGADLNVYNKFGLTALHNAVYFVLTSVIFQLLSKKAAKNHYNVIPLHREVHSMKMSTVELLLDNGANINAKDSEGNTALHEAARRADADITALLIRRGADVTLKNKTGDTPLFYALLFSSEDNENIVRLLEIAEKEARKSRDIVQSHGPHTSSRNNLDKKLKIMNLKSIEDSGFSGQLYETKMVTLFYLRCLSNYLIENLFLGVNLKDIGDMDDVCLRYQVRGQQRPVVLFVQGKHKNSSKSQITKKDLWSDSGGFDLRKYFQSFLTIKERFQIDNKDPMFQGKFEDIDCYFILYTPAQEYRQLTEKKTENKVSEMVHHLINTGQNSGPLQYNYDGTDIDKLIKAVAGKDALNLDLDSVKYYTEQAKIFFSSLWIYSSQANEQEVESITKKEINYHYNKNNDTNSVILEQYSDAIFTIVHHSIQKWSSSKHKPPYLTRSNDLFKLAKLIALADILLIFYNAMNCLNINVRLQFNFVSLLCTTATLGDINTILCKLLAAINSLKLNSNDMDFKTNILDVLTTEKLDHQSMLPSNDESDNVRSFLNSHDAILSNELLTKNEFRYLKRCGTSEVGGVLLKMKMSILIFRRALNHPQIDLNSVLLRGKIQGISMTDTCLRFLLKGQQRPLVLFMQFLYREKLKNGKLTGDEFWKDSGNFSFLKYFLSYLEIRERFRENNEDHLFEGEYRNVDCNFFLCTSAEESLTLQLKPDHHVSRVILDLINIEEHTTVFRFNHDETSVDRLVKMAIKDQIDKLGNVFSKYVFPGKYRSDLLSNELIAKYHVAMAQEVLQPCEEQPSINEYRIWKFRPEFFDSNFEHLITLKESLFRSQSKDKLLSLKLKLPSSFGNIDMTFRSNKSQTERIKLVVDKLMYLLEQNKDMKMVEINDDDVRPGKILTQGIIDINGGIGSAVGNLLIFDAVTKTLKFNLTRKSLPKNASLFLEKLLSGDRFKLLNRDLSVYRIQINVKNFPKSSFDDNENDKKQARDFLSKFLFFPIPAKENQVELIFKDEINKQIFDNKHYYRNGNISDLISLFSFDRMQRWSFQSNVSPYITQASKLFERVEQAYIYSLVQTVVHGMYTSGMHSIEIQIGHATNMYEKCKTTEQLFRKISSGLLNIFDPKKFDKLTNFHGFRSWFVLCTNASSLILKIYPKMETVLLIMTVGLGSEKRYRAFARLRIIPPGSGESSLHPKHKLMICEEFRDYPYQRSFADIV